MPWAEPVRLEGPCLWALTARNDTEDSCNKKCFVTEKKGALHFIFGAEALQTLHEITLLRLLVTGVARTAFQEPEESCTVMLL